MRPKHSTGEQAGNLSLQLSVTRSLWHGTGESRQRHGLACKPQPEVGTPQAGWAEWLGYMAGGDYEPLKAQGQEPHWTTLW